jgi:hypothetical protein
MTWREKDREARSHDEGARPVDEVRALLVGQGRVPASPTLVPFLGKLALRAPAESLNNASETAVPKQTNAPAQEHDELARIAQQPHQLRPTVRHHRSNRGKLHRPQHAKPELADLARLKSDSNCGRGQGHDGGNETCARGGERNPQGSVVEAVARVHEKCCVDWRRPRQLDFKTNVPSRK